MNGRDHEGLEQVPEVRKSGFGGSAKSPEPLEFSSRDLGQSYPHEYPHSESSDRTPSDVLGEPMTIREVASLLGCSVWTVRQRLLPSGLPYFRIGRTGKLMFYRNQIVRWVLERQRQKGGNVR